MIVPQIGKRNRSAFPSWQMLHSDEKKIQSFIIEFTLDLVAETPAESLGRGHTGL
jgi:hypothetical protein